MTGMGQPTRKYATPTKPPMTATMSQREPAVSNPPASSVRMLSGVLELIPSAKVSVVGIQRDEETLEPVAYYEKLSGGMPTILENYASESYDSFS